MFLFVHANIGYAALKKKIVYTMFSLFNTGGWILKSFHTRLTFQD